MRGALCLSKCCIKNTVGGGALCLSKCCIKNAVGGGALCLSKCTLMQWEGCIVLVKMPLNAVGGVHCACQNALLKMQWEEVHCACKNAL